MKVNLFFLGVMVPLSLGVFSPASAEKLRLDKLDRKTEVYLQRGLNDADSRCFSYILKKLRKEDTKQWYISFEEPDQDGVEFGAANSDSNYSCEQGQLVSYEIGKKEVIKSFRWE
ncbi:hypothetical protein [Brucella anthropi]